MTDATNKREAVARVAARRVLSVNFDFLAPDMEPSEQREFEDSITNAILALSPPAEGGNPVVGSLPWLRGLLEQKLEVACRADHADALFPMDERQAAAYHQTRADLLGWVLDMLPSDSPPLVRIDAAPTPAPVDWTVVGPRLVEALEKSLSSLQRLHTDVEALMADSDGVYGLHGNGDPAPWDELREGGQFEDWIGTPLWSARNAWHDGQAALAAAQPGAK